MGFPATADDVPTHHALPSHEILLLLRSDPRTGLHPDQAARRLRRYGPNTLPSVRAAGPLRRLAGQLRSPLVGVLLAAAAVTVFLGEVVDASVILGVVAVNAVVGFAQESKAQSALDALRSLVHTRTRVIRGGAQHTLASEQLVPGDVVLLDAGDRVPADLRVIAETELRVDESALTGESLPVDKDEVVLPAATPVADRRNMVYSGTLVTAGTGRGIVVATGGHTELGEIHRLVGAADTLATPLTAKLARFSAWLTVAILALAAVTFAVGVARGESAADMFTAAVALAVGAIPEGLPAAVTITLAIGVSRLARRRAVVRRLPAVETLGSATVICTDKTGTLTENRMTVQVLWTLTGEVPVAATAPAAVGDEALRWCLLVGANCNDSRLTATGDGVGDPTETAMLAVAERFGVPAHQWRRRDTVPFSSERQFMATTQHPPHGGPPVLMAKGSVEQVLVRCRAALAGDGAITALDPAAVLAAAEQLAARGLRVLATAVDLAPADDALERVNATRGWVFAGLQAMLDPPRGTARAAVATCRAAGVQVKLITGDHAATAGAVARQVGVADDRQQVLTGAQLDALADEDLPAAAEQASVFARVTPGQKLRLVRALQSRGHVVAMTGDGVNDAPALKQADIGVAMGRGGTEVAKDAADIVLTDDDFATIQAAVEEGRGVFDNLVKFIVWTLPTNMGEGMVILVAILTGATLPILPTQILWINMTTAVALGLMLAWEPKEAGIMRRPPRDPARALLTGPIVVRTALVSVLLVAGTWWVFDYESGHGASLAASRTAAVNLFVAVAAGYLLSCRSLHAPVWRTGAFTNRVLVAGVAVQLGLQLALTYLPVLQALFATAPIGWQSWARILLVAVLTVAVVGVDKRRLRGVSL